MIAIQKKEVLGIVNPTYVKWHCSTLFLVIKGSVGPPIYPLVKHELELVVWHTLEDKFSPQMVVCAQTIWE